MPDGDKVRTNGLQFPPHKLQVTTWVLFPILLGHFYGFLRPLIWYPDSLGVALIVIFSSACVVTVAAGYTTCFINPADDSLLCVPVGFPSNAPATASSIYCYLCESNVDKSSKHCRYCQKCVTRFDHHCKVPSSSSPPPSSSSSSSTHINTHTHILFLFFHLFSLLLSF